MREIKFRVWDTKFNRMIYSSYPDGGDELYLTLEGEIEYLVRLPMSMDMESEDNSHLTLMQSTGLNDKKGTEIFEGDIISHPGVSKTQVVSLSPDENKNYFIWRYIHDMEESQIEVIGNIHEHPHLLEDKG